ncbi:MAG: hypothetical protein ACREUS_04870 [Burkholderiales bacterium]
MGRIIVIVLLIAAGFAWYKGWIGEWFGAAVDSGAQSVRQTQRDATKMRPADPGAPEADKK